MKTKDFIKKLSEKYPYEKEYLQAVKEVVESIETVYNANPLYEKASILERLVEPDRSLYFRVSWVDDKGGVRVNTGYRIQFNNAIGPYKGGLRFHPSVTPSILKFLGFEQTLKNALTTLPMGGAKGGSDFDPKGKSDGEIMRFCQAFMLELWRIIGPETDVPAGDIGVTGKEIGYLYGMYRKLARENTGVLTGKGMNYGGSLLRPEATGFGGVYLVSEVLKSQKTTLKGKTAGLSGFGNVAWGAGLKLIELGAKVITISGPDGYIYVEKGMTKEMIDYLAELRATNNDVVEPFAKKFKGAKFTPNAKPWAEKMDVAFPCATQNELDGKDAINLVKNGTICVGELSNMGCTPEAAVHFIKSKIAYIPGKAGNAGGVSTSGLEMSQNSLKMSWTEEEVDAKLHQIMKSIHDVCVKYGTEKDGYVNYMKGANIAGFVKVANSMLEQGVV